MFPFTTLLQWCFRWIRNSISSPPHQSGYNMLHEKHQKTLTQARWQWRRKESTSWWFFNLVFLLLLDLKKIERKDQRLELKISSIFDTNVFKSDAKSFSFGFSSAKDKIRKKKLFSRKRDGVGGREQVRVRVRVRYRRRKVFGGAETFSFSLCHKIGFKSGKK